MIYQLYQTPRLYTKTLNNELREMGIYTSEWSVLSIIGQHKIVAQSDLVKYLEVEPAAISKTMSKLEKKGIIERKFLKDKREKYISMTPRAEELYQELREKVLEHRRLALSNMTESERIQLYILLKKVHANLSE
jgi:MarR family transcriptional regulator for hemolysin